MTKATWLSMLIQVRDEDTGEQMTDDPIRCEALTFLIAGHETTATALNPHPFEL